MNLAQLIAAGVAPTQARLFVEPLKAACALFDISTPARKAAFIAQCAHESVYFTRLEESLYYRSAERIREIFPSRVKGLDVAAKLTRNPKDLANTVYANRLGNGDYASGDGWTFRGRGAFQLTGRNNYADASNELGRPYVERPDLVAEPSDACLTAAWYFAAEKCNLLADSAQWDAITRAINGPAMVDADKRRSMTDEALRAFA